jgi:membrane fusion protein (multidrug efflux system)
MFSHNPLPAKNNPIQVFSRNQTSRLSLTVLLGFSLLLGGCAGGGGGGWQMPPPVVIAKTALQQPWTVEYTASGTLEAENKVDLNTETPGVITQIAVKEGQPVYRGQVLLRMNADKQQAQVQQAAAGINTSKGSLAQQGADISQARARANSAMVKYKQAQSEYQRYQKLLAEQFVSQLELDQKRSAFESAQADYQEAKEGLSSAKASYSQAGSNLAQARSSYRYNVALASESVIRAPFNGIIGQKYVALGGYVAPTEKLITVVDPSTFKIQFPVPERYLSQLYLGQSVNVNFEALGNTPYGGRVNFIDPVINADARTVMVKAILPGRSSLRHGLFGTVDLALNTIQNAVVVPEEAIVPQGEKTFVYVIRHEIFVPTPIPGAPKKEDKNAPKAPPEPSDVAHLREVVVGHRKTGKVQIESGLAAGEQVIVSGLQKVNDNMEVNLDAGKGKASTPGASGPKGH